jgi:hypothetical protein
MRASIFLSYPKPCYGKQEKFIELLNEFLKNRGFVPRTLGVTDYDMDTPLTAIRRLMLDCNGVLTIAFRRTYIQNGTGKYRTDLQGTKEVVLEDQWLTSPWAQIEAAMGFQIGLPILILREDKVLDEGILEKGILGLYMPNFNLDNNIEEYFKSMEWRDMIGRWEGYVSKVVENKGNPPKLY